MLRRRVVATFGIICVIVLGIGVTLLMLVRYEPSLYAQADLPEGIERIRCSDDFFGEFTNLINGSINGERLWATFTEEQINSYLTEGFVHQGLAERVLPDSISQPRVLLSEDQIRLVCRYGDGFWSTYLTLDLRLWLPEHEANVVAVQILGLYAGALPISSHFLLERISETARRYGIEVSWYRHESYPVAILRFQTDQSQSRGKFLLTELSLNQKTLTIKGTSSEP